MKPLVSCRLIKKTNSVNRKVILQFAKTRTNLKNSKSKHFMFLFQSKMAQKTKIKQRGEKNKNTLAMNNQMILKSAEAENKTLPKKKENPIKQKQDYRKKTEQKAIQKNAINHQLIREKEMRVFEFFEKKNV